MHHFLRCIIIVSMCSAAIPALASAQRQGGAGGFDRGASGPGARGVRHDVKKRMTVPGRKLWELSPRRPLTVDRVFNFTQSGPGGLNNLFWAVVHAIGEGCGAVAETQQRSMVTTAGGDAPTDAGHGFGVVLLPPLRSNYKPQSEDPTVAMHSYSDIFELGPLASHYASKHNCFVSDSPSFDRQVASGAVRLSPEAQRHDSSQELGTFTYHPSYQMLRPLYQRLELSKSLSQRYIEPCLEKVREAFGGDEPDMAFHMRVEDDWVDRFCESWTPAINSKSPDYYRKVLDSHGRKVYFAGKCFGADEMVRMIYDVPELSSNRNVLMIYAEENFKRPGHQRHPDLGAEPTEVWPQGVVAVNAASLRCFAEPSVTYTMKSALSFFLAGTSRTFVGLGDSSMSKGIASFRETRSKLGGTYFYGCYSGPRCGYVADVVNGRGNCLSEWKIAERLRSRADHTRNTCSSAHLNYLRIHGRNKITGTRQL